MIEEYKVEGMTRGDAYYIFKHLEDDYTDEEKLEAIYKVTGYLKKNARPRNRLVQMPDMLNALIYLTKELKKDGKQ